MRGIFVILVILSFQVFAGRVRKAKVPSAEDRQKARAVAIRAANKKYPEKMRRRLEIEAFKMFRASNVGDSLTTKVGSRRISGKLRKVMKNTVYIGDFEVHRMHFPSHLFDKSLAKDIRRDYVESRFDRPRRKLIEKLYLKALKSVK